MRRRSFIAAGLLASLTPAVGWARDRVHKLGILDGGRARPAKSYDFVRKLKDHGFEEGRNLAVQVTSGNFEYDDLDRLARDVVAERPDVIVAMGPSSIAAAAGATRTIPIVMLHSGDPVALGLVPNLARPGGNITGNGWEQDVRQVAKGLIAINDYITIMYAKSIDAIIQRRKLPALMSGRVPGSLFDSAILHYGPRMSEYPAVTAEYIARIFKGARPGDLPIVLPSRWEIALNPRAAASMGVVIPDSLRLRADEVIE